jgi:single-strand DNA-binding protein
MAGYNRVVLMGNLTRDPELTYTPSNTAVCKFGLAMNRKWKDQGGNQKEEVTFVDVTLFGRSAETFNQYMSKGKPVMLEGRLHFSQWTDKEGKNRSKLDVIAERFVFVGSANGDGQQRQGGQGGARTSRQAPEQAPPPDDDFGPPPDADLPF